MMTPQEIQNRLNLITIQELKDHYNKPECYRILDDECKSYKMACQLREDILEDIKTTYSGIEVEVLVSNIGVINVYQITEKTEYGKTTKELFSIRASIVDMIPYAYVMGGKLSKRQMEASIVELERVIGC